MDGRTLGGKITQSGGGVARNLADALGKLQINPCLISAVGDEEFGDFVLDRTIPHLSRRGIMKSKESGTGTCMVLCDHTGECLVVVGDMGIHEKITKDHVMNHAGAIAGSSLVVLDGNLSVETTEFVLRLCYDNSVPVWFEPTDVFRAAKPFLNREVPPPSFISPNFLEFKKIHETVYPDSVVDENSNQIEECVKHGYLLAELIDNIVITLGKKGVMVIRRGGSDDGFFKGKQLYKQGPITHRLYTPDPIEGSEIVNVSGAGDCFASGFIAAMLKGKSEKVCVESGFKCSTAALKCPDAVPDRPDHALHRGVRSNKLMSVQFVVSNSKQLVIGSTPSMRNTADYDTFSAKVVLMDILLSYVIAVWTHFYTVEPRFTNLIHS